MSGLGDDRIDASDVREEDRAYLKAYFAAALKGHSFQTCKVTWLHPTEPRILFVLVFDDGSQSEILGISPEAALVQDRSDEVVYDDSGARRTRLGFVQNGVLKGIVDNAFSRKRVE